MMDCLKITVFLELIKTVIMSQILLFIFLIIGINVPSYSQYQSVFGNKTTTWVIEAHNLGTDFQIDFFVEKDTILNSFLSYKKIVAHDNGYTQELLREDTTTGRVWFKSLTYFTGIPDPSDTIERLAVDMTLQIGDTFSLVSDLYVDGWPDSLSIVDSVYYNQGLKHIRFKAKFDNGTVIEPVTFIEGIGLNYGILWKRLKGRYLGQYLLCAYKDSVKVNYTNLRHSGNCYPFTGLNNIEIEEISQYPNPLSNEILFLNLPKVELRLMITNILGENIYSSNNITNDMSLEFLSQGYYLMYIYQNEKVIFQKKIIKLNHS